MKNYSFNKLFIAVKLIKNAEKDKYKYSEQRIGFDNHGTFLLSNGSGFGNKLVNFGADMSSFVHADNKRKDI